MKIGLFTDGYLPQVNGVATSVATLAKALKKEGHSVYVVAPKYPDYRDDHKVFRLTSIKFPDSQYRLAFYLPERSLIETSQIDFDIIHGHPGGPVTLLGLQIAKIKKIPFVYTYHTMWNRYTHYILKGKVVTPKMMEIASKFMCNLADCVVAPTTKILEELNRYGVDKPIVVIPSGVEVLRFRNAEKGYLRKKLEISQNDYIMLFVGRLEKEKRIEFIIKAFKVINKNLSNTCLVIAGEGSEEENLKYLTKKLKLEKSVKFIGRIPFADIAKVYKGADVFVFASHTETQGLVILEAMASGIPVVAVSDLAFTDFIKSRENGILTNDSISDFSKAIVEILKNKGMRNSLINEADKTVERYSIETMGQAHEILYKKLIDENKPKPRLKIIFPRQQFQFLQKLFSL